MRIILESPFFQGDDDNSTKDEVPVKRPESKLKSLVNKHSGGPLSKVKSFLVFILVYFFHFFQDKLDFLGASYGKDRTFAVIPI